MKLRNGKTINNAPTRERKLTTETDYPVTAYKKARDNKLIILEIPSWASHNIDRENVFDKQYAKHRCSAALVKEIIDLHTGKNFNTALSIHDCKFVYNVGEIIKPKYGFCEFLNEVCAEGVHFFLDRETAETYGGWYHCDREIKTRYDNGRIHTQCTYYNGKRHGEYRAWHTNGMLQEYGFFNNGLKEGVYYEFYETGQTSCIYTRINGKYHGDYKTWYWNGQLKENGTFKNDIATGIWRTWNEKGELIKEKTY